MDTGVIATFFSPFSPDSPYRLTARNGGLEVVDDRRRELLEKLRSGLILAHLQLKP